MIIKGVVVVICHSVILTHILRIVMTKIKSQLVQLLVLYYHLQLLFLALLHFKTSFLQELLRYASNILYWYPFILILLIFIIASIKVSSITVSHVKLIIYLLLLNILWVLIKNGMNMIYNTC